MDTFHIMLCIYITQHHARLRQRRYLENVISTLPQYRSTIDWNKK